MHKIAFVVLGTLVLSVHAANAQTSAVQPAPRTITVVGTSELEVVPDQASVTVNVSTFEKDINEGKLRHDQRSRELQDIAVKHGVRPTDIQSGRVMIWSERTDRGKPRNVRLHSTVTFRIRDLSKYDELLSAFVNAGVESVQATHFTVSERAKHEAQARLMAVRSAREQATAMAGALGQKIGNPLSVIETQDLPIVELQPTYRSIRSTVNFLELRNVRRQREEQVATEPEAIAPGQIIFKMKVAVTFELI